MREEINNWLSDDDRLQTPYELVARELVDIDKLDELLLKNFDQVGDQALDLQNETDVDPQHAEGLPMPLAKGHGAEVAKFKDIIRSSDIEKINDLIMIDKRFEHYCQSPRCGHWYQPGPARFSRVRMQRNTG